MEKEISIIASLFSIVAAVISVISYKKSVNNETIIKKLVQNNSLENNRIENSNVVQNNYNKVCSLDKAE